MPLALLRKFAPLAVALCAIALSACVYRPNIQQGNLLKTEDVDKVQPGMTRSQVRFTLGTPMVTDPFNPQRWDYVYTLTHGRDRQTDRAHFVVHFEGDTVSRVEKPDALDPPLPPKELSWWQKVRRQQAPPVAPPPPSTSLPTDPDLPTPPQTQSQGGQAN